MEKKLKYLVIDRAKWLTGRAIENGIVSDSMLRDPETGLQCCLGFLARREGCTIRQINNKETLQGLKGVANKLICKALEIKKFDYADYHGSINNKLDRLMDVNDRMRCHSEVRERKIAEGLRELGYEVVFTGEYPEELR